MRKNFLFGLLAILLAGFWFGGASLADNVAKIGNGECNTDGTTCYESLSDAITAANNGDTITLLENITLTNDIRIVKNVNLDMGGKTIDGDNQWALVFSGVTSEISNGTITSQDPNYAVVYIQHGANVTINNGTYSNKNTPIVVSYNSIATINSGTFTSSKESGISVTQGATLNINDATVNAQEAGVLVTNGATVIISGGTFTTVDNFVVGTNGSAGKGNNTITINGGVFNGNIITDGFIACGIYVANNDTVTVNGGTFNVPNGVGIVARGGITNVSKDVVFDVSSNESLVGKVGDSKIRVPNNKEVVIDLASGYPGSNEGDFQVTAKNVTVVEGATPTQHDVKFAEGDNTLTVKKSNSMLVVDIVSSEEGYQWYNGDETTPYVFNSAITGNVTLTSRINTYTIKFDANAEGVDNPTDEVINHGATVTEPQVTNTGYVLVGWFKDDNKYDFSTPVTESFTLTGKWEALSDSTGTVEDEDFTGVVLVPEEPEITGNAQTNIETAIASSNSTATMEGVVEVVVFTDNDEDGQVEAGDVELTGKVNFTTARLVRIPVNTTGNVVVKVRHTGQSGFSYDGLSTSSGATCSGGNATPAYNGESITPTSGYVEIYTCAASTFVAYTETANPAPRSSGGGGSSYSCKNLPANAVANNTTKPKKNTDYSYSTDTGAVCTFQCKTGYTWNEKDAKCEKATETVADTNDTTVTENTENADTSDSASTEDLQKVLEDGYNVEFHKAYEFAFQNGITTMPTIQEGDMNGNLNRIAMAKMLSQYAINVLGKTPDTTKEVPNFPDVDAQLDADYNNGVTLAYQLGIMGINVKEFRPFDLVTRAEFGTALSRMLFGIADGTELYYETHMQKLLEEKIITVANPDMHELRGYVMIMLMRSANK